MTPYTEYYRNYSIMANDNLSVKQDIMDILIDRIEFYTTNYSRTFVIFFGLNYPHYVHVADNNAIQEFMDRFLKYLNVTRGSRPMYVWVREQSSSDNPHYHFMLLLDGRKIQNRYGIMAEATRLWGAINRCDGNGLVHFATDSMMLRTDSSTYSQDVAQCIYYSSYMAKTNTKGNAPYRQREYGCTQLSRFITKYPSR